jgi:hypothetical protein
MRRHPRRLVAANVEEKARESGTNSVPDPVVFLERDDPATRNE